MAQIPKEPIHIQAKPIGFPDGQELPSPNPFRIYISQSNPTVNIKISPYSVLLNSPNILDEVTLVGLDIDFPIVYGNKIWLETYFDKNLSPIIAIINTGNKWAAQVVGVNSTNISVYPNELEFITKLDLQTKIGEVANLINYTNNIKQKSIDSINTKKNLGFLTADEATVYLNQIQISFTDVQSSLKDYQNNLSQFFSNAPTVNTKKLFRTYTLIGYTTKNLDVILDGSTVTPDSQAPTTNTNVPQSIDDPTFKLVQCLNNDLLLADICYQNRFPAKLPIPYHRPVYYYVNNGQDEEAENTK